VMGVVMAKQKECHNPFTSNRRGHVRNHCLE
jgi:hypothetical protein